MGFMALRPELDARLPLSSILWHVLFWGMTSNHTILPDGHGSGARARAAPPLSLARRSPTRKRAHPLAPERSSRHTPICSSRMVA